MEAIRRYFHDIWFDIKHTPEYVIDVIRARDDYHWQELKYNLYTIKRDIFHPVYCIKRGLKNLYRWFPVVWLDRDFDHCYLQIVMEKKLQFMEEFFRSGDTHLVGSRHTAKQIAYARKLLNYTFDYPTPYLDKFYEKYGHHDFEHVPCQFDSLGKPMAYEMVSNRTEEYDVAWKSAHYKDMEIEKMIDKHLYKFIGKRVRGWWD
jgi:hypothetical protein